MSDSCLSTGEALCGRCKWRCMEIVLRWSIAGSVQTFRPRPSLKLLSVDKTPRWRTSSLRILSLVKAQGRCAGEYRENYMSNNAL